MTQADTHQMDLTDPHGNTSHEHHIVAWQLQVIILAVLLFLTALTVGVSQTEIWIADTWDVHIPNWVNIAGAMSIATVKAFLVMAFFMQLKYDKPLNTIVMLFCFFCVGLFLMFTMIDLSNRDKVIPYKAVSPSPGGTGYNLSAEKDSGGLSARLSPHVNTGGLPLVEFRYEEAVTNFFSTEAGEKYAKDPFYGGDKEMAFWHNYYMKSYVKVGKEPHAHERDENHHFDTFVTKYHDEIEAAGLEVHGGHGGHGDAAHTSTANHSRPRHGLTPGLFDEHGSDHGDSHGDDHADSSADHSDAAGHDDGHTDDAATGDTAEPDSEAAPAAESSENEAEPNG